MRDRIANRTDALERKIGSLQLQASRDVLSGLGNRRGLESALPKILERHHSTGTDFALLMIDVDHFKPLNDTLGHAAGDQLLRELGQLIRSTLRGNDQAFRCGGDEFVVLLDSCDIEAGRLIATRLELLVKRLTEPLKVARPPQLSIGVCALSELNPATVESFLQTADARLYAVKAQRPGARRSA
jgi:diguanylate cyclase (GGDEF)-like protein